MARRVRVTLRCLTEDLKESIPGPHVDLGGIEHPLVEECRRLAPLAPRGQKRIQSIDFPMVYRVSHGQRLRGASWVEEEKSLFWLLAAEWHEEGSPGDAYLYFEALSKSDRLLPTRDDYVRDRVEEGARLLAGIKLELPGVLAGARGNQDTDYSGLLLGRVEVVIHMKSDEGFETIWMAVSAMDNERNAVDTRLRDMIFAIAEEVLGNAAEWEWTSDWPTDRELRWFELGRLAIRETG